MILRAPLLELDLIFHRIPSTKPRPILDSEGRIIALIAGAPNEATYKKDAMDLFDVIVEESNSRTFTKKERKHKRGDFPAINFGFTLPNGFDCPRNLDNKHHAEKIERICGTRGFERISGHQNGTCVVFAH